MTRSEIRGHCEQMARLGKADRRRYLQALIGPPTDDSGVLQVRALLMTALNDACIWPPRK